MNNFSREIQDFFIISLITLTLFFIHQFLILEIFKNEKTPLISIYFFNYFAILVLLSFFKLNLYYKLTNSLELSDVSIGLAKIFAEKSNSKSEVQILENLKSIFAKISSY